MKLIHTGDWHLGATLYGRTRSKEHERFLNWLHGVVVQERIDALLVAGDVFDSVTPDHQALRLFHQFLEHIAESPCRLVAIVAGERDAPGLLETPHELLDKAGVQLFIEPSADGADEVLVLGDSAGHAQLVLCAVPNMRGRACSPEAIQRHYAMVIEAAGRERTALGLPVPMVVLGHLRIDAVPADGSETLPAVPAALFPPSVAYAALGHVHAPHPFGEGECGYYCGSPLPLSFNEAGVTHCVVAVALDGYSRTITPLAVPTARHLVQIRGTVAEAVDQLGRLSAEGSRAWIEVVYNRQTGTNTGEPAETIRQALEGSGLLVLRLAEEREVKPLAAPFHLPELPPPQVPLTKLFDMQHVPPDKRESLLAVFSAVTAAPHAERPDEQRSDEP